jgi:hypothetical protein
MVKLLSSKKLQKDINTILDAEEPIVALENMIQNNPHFEEFGALILETIKEQSDLNFN